MSLTLTIEIESNTQSDLEMALEEVHRLIQKGFLCGSIKNEDNSSCFRFDVTGEEELEEDAA